MGVLYADIEDITALYRELTEEETERAEALLPMICSRLRTEAQHVGKNLDVMITEDDTGDLANIAKQVTVDIVARALMTPTSGDLAPLSQYSQSALGYTVSGTFLSPGGGLFIKNSELAALGLRRQKYGTIQFEIGKEFDDAD